MADSLEGCPWAAGDPAEEAGCGRRGQAAMAPPSGWWRMSGGECQRQGQATTVVRKSEVDGGGEAERR
jgi:hypothetical protein